MHASGSDVCVGQWWLTIFSNVSPIFNLNLPSWLRASLGLAVCSLYQCTLRRRRLCGIYGDDIFDLRFPGFSLDSVVWAILSSGLFNFLQNCWTLKFPDAPMPFIQLTLLLRIIYLWGAYWTTNKHQVLSGIENRDDSHSVNKVQSRHSSPISVAIRLSGIWT